MRRRRRALGRTRVCSVRTSKSGSRSGAASPMAVALSRDGLVVAPRHGSGEGRLGTERRPVVDGPADERCQELARVFGGEPCGARDALGGGFEGHEIVRGDGGGRMIGGALLVGDHEGMRAERRREVQRGIRRLLRAACDGAADAAERVRALVADERLERVQAEVDVGEGRRAGRVADESAVAADGGGRTRRWRRRARRGARYRRVRCARRGRSARSPGGRRRAARVPGRVRGALRRRW